MVVYDSWEEMEEAWLMQLVSPELWKENRAMARKLSEESIDPYVVQEADFDPGVLVPGNFVEIRGGTKCWCGSGHRTAWEPLHISSRVDYVSKTVVVVVDIGKTNYLFWTKDLRDNIVRVLSDGVQVWPRGKCPFKVGDQLRNEHFPDDDSPRTVADTRYVGGKWEVLVAYGAGDGAHWHRADVFRLIPSPEWEPKRDELVGYRGATMRFSANLRNGKWCRLTWPDHPEWIEVLRSDVTQVK